MDIGSNHRRHAAAGFTLLELLVTTVVIGVIMAIIVSTLLQARDKSRQGATIADMRNIATAIEAYTVDNVIYPSTQPFPDLAELLRPYHSTHVPVDDHWGHRYTYVSLAENDYSLISLGRDGADGADLTPDTRREFDRDIVITNGEFPGLR